LGSITVLTQLALHPNTSLSRQVLGICERVASLALFAAVSPVLVGSALAMTLRSGRTPLIAHRRVGWQGSPLWMLKLRTMWPAISDSGEELPPRRSGWIEYIDDDLGPQLKHPADARVTSPFARFCRRHSIDELPQLWHVVRGQMSLVGPRPMTEGELRRYYGAAAQEILQVRPGLAGLWQISGRNRLTYAERRDLDLKLVRGRCARLYIQILLRTVPEVLSGSGSW
jgi:lipopolysaccharide/colanic/teichoic acid biosynthesis glycosyltransferase